MAKNMQRDSSQDPDIARAMMSYMNRLIDKFMASVKPVRDGNNVVIRSDTQYGMAAAGMLTALLLPAVQAAREAASRNVSQNNLKQIGLAILNYESAYKRMPARAIFDKEGKPLLSWRVQMLPFLEEVQLYKQFHLDEPWDSEHNKALIDKMPAVYKHPHFNEPGKTLYQAVVGKGCAFEGKEGVKLSSFTDGTSRTIMVVETAPDKAVVWTKPDDWEMDANNPLKGLGGLFAGGIFNALFADCHVQTIAMAIDPATFKAMCTRNGGEEISP